VGALLRELLPTVPAGSLMFEVGSERGGGSTELLAAWARECGAIFISVDIDPAQAIAGPTGVIHAVSSAEEFTSALVPDCELRFAYLDGFDWPYPPEILDPGELRWYEQHYASLGLALTAVNSQASHLAVAREIHRVTYEGAVVVFDDTWKHEEWDGKGGTAVPFLLENGWVITHSAHSPPFNAYVRLVRSP